MFEKKTWVNRQSEHPARRRLTPTGNDNEYDVARAEGVIMEDGDAFDAETMNDLEKRVAEGFSTLDPADLGADVCVQVYACVKSGTVYELTGSGAVGRCKIPAAWNSGDTWSVNGKAVPAYCGADAVDSDCIVAGRWVLFTFDGQRLDFNGGGGLSSGKLAQATAAESDVLSGKKFYAGNKNLKTGTLALSGSAGTGDVLRGATFYKDDPKSKLTGTLALSGNANAAQVLSGYTFYKDNAKSKQTGTMANNGGVSVTLNPGSSYVVPAGYHNGGGRVKAATWTKDKYLYLVIQYQNGYGIPMPEYAATVVAQGIPEPGFLAHYSGGGNVNAVKNVCNANMLNIEAYAQNGTAQITPLTYLYDIFRKTNHDPGVVYTLGAGVYCYRMR